jgi:hypothetical protein
MSSMSSTSTPSSTSQANKASSSNRQRQQQSQKYAVEIEKEVRFRMKKQEETYKIQQVLIENQLVTESYLLDCASFLQSSHFNDVILERGLSGRCGYPICSNSVSTKLVSQIVNETRIVNMSTHLSNAFFFVSFTSASKTSTFNRCQSKNGFHLRL